MDEGEVIVDRVDGAWVLTLRGEHDLSTKPSLREELEWALARGSTVIVDLSQVTFIDSTVLRGLIFGHDAAVKHNEHTVVVVAPRRGPRCTQLSACPHGMVAHACSNVPPTLDRLGLARSCHLPRRRRTTPSTGSSSSGRSSWSLTSRSCNGREGRCGGCGTCPPSAASVPDPVVKAAT